jgi:glycosyltransferase involved in cell wall biosynthesis
LNILHYTIGLPPNRSGGLTKYATDLMKAQSDNGDIVTLLYPGEYTFFGLPKIRIIKDPNFNRIAVYQLKDTSIIPLLYGIRSPSDISNAKRHLSSRLLELFYLEVQPEIFHIHTLMGLPLELVSFLKEKKVRIVFTSHDYYGLCPKVNFINYKGEFCNTPGGEQCAMCNLYSPGSVFLRLRNSKVLLKYKTNLASFKKAEHVKKAKPLKEVYPTQAKELEFTALINYYKSLFEFIDCFHFNSTVSKEVYEQFLIPKQSVVLPISHDGIVDRREFKLFDQALVRLAFIGSTTDYKGYPMLKEVLSELNFAGVKNWLLQVWGSSVGSDPKCGRIKYMGKFTSADFEKVFSEMDLLIVPSICKETFSLVALEALSYGVPVMVSDNVGAKDIVAKYNADFIFQPSIEALQLKLKNILANPSLLTDFNEKIRHNKFEYSLDDHQKKIKQFYNFIG